ncbi:DUF6531 domain-containing protein [Sorangium sp. So ce834]|uniref:DUF6531 domain-containing protein n=1 Tax=Sorangium sp. So ce834 TaxID=3133321 RepID=UPI003F5FE267
MAHNFHDINGWLIVGLEMHQGFHIFPPAPMKFLKLVLLHPFTLGDRQQPTVLFNGVPSVTHQHEPKFLWPHLGIIPDPLDALTPLHILFGSHKCWLPRGAVEICGEKATCCVIGGPVSLNADCWDIGRWPTSLVLNPGTVQTTPTFGDFAMGAVTLAIDLVLDLLFEGAAKIAGGLLLKFGGKVLKPLFKKGKDLVGKGLRAATKQMGKAGKALGKGARALKGKAASALKNLKCRVTGHPVDTTSGRVIDAKLDIKLPGAIPLAWERRYASDRALERTSLGRGGWTHSFEQWIERTEDGLVLRDEEGRDVYFRLQAPGSSAFHRPDRLTLTALEDGGFTVYSHETRLTRRFAPAESGEKALLRSISDAHGNTIALEYTGSRLQRIVDTAGREIRVKLTHGARIARLEVWAGGRLEQWVDYAYSKMGELASATDAIGHAERYEYDEDHRMVKTTLKNGVSFYYAYDEETGRCTRTWGDGGLHTVAIEADLERRITRLSGNDEPRLLYWNEDGLVVREETPDGLLLRAWEYDEDQYIAAEINGAGEATRFEYDAQGNKTRQIDPAGNVTQWQYQDDLPVLHVGPDGLATRYRYDRKGSLVEITYPSELRYALAYDGRGHLRAIAQGQRNLVEYAYDIRHDLVEEINAYGGKTRYEPDALGRPTRSVDPLGRSTRVQYDRLGQPVMVMRPDGTARHAAYDPLGNLSRSTDALGRVVEMEHAGTGVLTKITQPDGSTWRFAYSAGESLRRIVNPKGEIYDLAYDEAGRLTREAAFDGRALSYRYSAAGRLERVSYPDGSFRAFSYDALGGLVVEQSTDGPVTYQRDRLGRLLGAVLEQDGQTVVTRLERDRLGRVVAETQGERRIGYHLDASGRRVARIMPTGEATRYAYDALGRLSAVEHAGRRIAFERDAVGREIARGELGGRFSLRSEYDAMDRIVEQRLDLRSPGAEAATMAMRRLWQYDALGRVQLVNDARWGATAYRHGSIDELIEARSARGREVFTYDAVGAVQKVLRALEAGEADEAEPPWEIARGDTVQRTDRAEYAYDGRSRRIARTETAGEAQDERARTEYRWDCRDRLREIRLPSGKSISFTYDAFGRRVRKEVRADDPRESHVVEFLWDGDALAADIRSEGGYRCFVHEPDSLVPLLQAEQGEVFVYVTDHVGTPRELIDAEGRVAWSAAHSAWGSVAAIHQAPERRRPVESPFRLLGQYADEETGLCVTRFRYFDAELARWLSPDPLGFASGGSLFAFNASPVTTVDPLGLKLCDGTIYRALSADDYDAFLRGERIMPKGTGGSIGDHVAGKPTKYISASETPAGTSHYQGGSPVLVEIDVKALRETGSTVVDHNNVLQAVKREGTALDLRNAIKAEEVLIKGGIDPSAIKVFKKFWD